MIKTKRELDFYIAADYIMNRGKKPSFQQRVKELFWRDYIIEFLVLMRKVDYYYSIKKKFYYVFFLLRFRKVSLKLNFSIDPHVFGYGLVIPHVGTIVVGEGNEIGCYSVLHTSTCITSGRKKIGDGLYVSVGAKIVGKDVVIGDNVVVAANAVVTKSFDGNSLLVGVPAVKTDTRTSWYANSSLYRDRHEKVELLKKQLGLDFDKKL